MELTPNRIYENYRGKTLNEGDTIKFLLDIIENAEDNAIKKESIKVLNKIDFKNKNIFKILEYILISEENDDLRLFAAHIIKEKYPNKAIKPFLWALKHEKSYNFQITIIKTLRDLNDDKVIKVLSNELNRISSREYGSYFYINKKNSKLFSSNELGNILINQITIRYLKKKFNKLKFLEENGFITHLDFSDVDKQVIYWRDRDAFQDHSEILGIENLVRLKKIKFFSIQWAIKDEFNFKSSIALIKALERLNNKAAKDVLIDLVRDIDDKKFKSSFKHFARKFEDLSLSKLSDIFRNYLAFSYLRKKYPIINYKISKGEVISIHIEKVPLVTFPCYIKYFRSLRSLILKQCALYKINKSIASLTSLKVLDLEGNNLKDINNSILSLISLKLLNLSKNRIDKIPNSIATLSSLLHLNLEMNNLTHLPKSIGNLSSLKFLNVCGNKLEKIPSSIGALKSLQSLNLKQNKIINLPGSIGLLYSLEFLNLSNNKLEKLPDSLNSISSLKVLNLEDNNLTFLPDSIVLLNSLEVLKIGWNNLENIPDSLETLKSLKNFYLNNNKLQKLSKSICMIKSLEYLDLSHNKLIVLPEDFGELKLLKALKLTDNQIKTLPESIGSLNSLEKLYLSGNNIEFLPETIGLLSFLKEIWLIGNELKDLPNSFTNLKSLKKLKLNDNYFTKLPKTLIDMPSLEEISLNWNNLENINDFPDSIKY